MNIVSKTQLNSTDIDQIFDLWNNEYPTHLEYKTTAEFEKYIAHLSFPNHFLVLNNNTIQAWAVSFIRETEKWFVIIIHSNSQHKGIGTQLLNQLKNNQTQLNGWVIDHNSDTKTDGTPYKSPLQFYLKNGFEIIPQKRLESIAAVKVQWNRPL